MVGRTNTHRPSEEGVLRISSLYPPTTIHNHFFAMMSDSDFRSAVLSPNCLHLGVTICNIRIAHVSIQRVVNVQMTAGIVFSSILELRRNEVYEGHDVPTLGSYHIKLVALELTRVYRPLSYEYSGACQGFRGW